MMRRSSSCPPTDRGTAVLIVPFLHHGDTGLEKKSEKCQFRACKLLKTKGCIFQISIFSLVHGEHGDPRSSQAATKSPVQFLVSLERQVKPGRSYELKGAHSINCPFNR